MLNCPNKSHPDYKKIAEKYGDDIASYLSFVKGDIPSVEEVESELANDKKIQESNSVKMEKTSVKVNTSKPVAIWAMAGTGKSYLASKYPDQYIDFDDFLKPFKPRINALYNEGKESEADEMVIKLWKKATELARNQNMTLLGSQQAILKSNEDIVDELYYIDSEDKFQSTIQGRKESENKNKDAVKQRFESNMKVIRENPSRNKQVITGFLSDEIHPSENLKGLKDLRRALASKFAVKLGIVSSPVHSPIVDNSLNIDHLNRYYVGFDAFVPVLLPAILDNPVAVKKLSTMISGLQQASKEERIALIEDAMESNEELSEFLTGEARMLLSSLSSFPANKVAEARFVNDLFDIQPSARFMKPRNSVSFTDDADADEEVHFVNDSVGTVPVKQQSETQRVILGKFNDSAKIVDGSHIDVSIEEVLKAARNRKERQYLEQSLKGESIVRLYRRVKPDGTVTFVMKRVSFRPKYDSNRFKTVEEIKGQDRLSEVYRRTGTSLHLMQENVVNKIFSRYNFEQMMWDKFGANTVSPIMAKKFAEEIWAEWNTGKVEKGKSSLFTDADKYKEERAVLNDEKKRLTLEKGEGKIFSRFVPENAKYGSKMTPDNRNKKHIAMIEAMVKSLLEDYIGVIALQHNKNVAKRKKDPAAPLGRVNVITERIIFDEVEDEAGTIDFLAIFDDGDAAILDYKFMKAKFSRVTMDDGRVRDVFDEDQTVGNYIKNKQEGHRMQLARYSEVLTKLYGVKRVIQVRIKPTYVEYSKNKEGVVDDNSYVKAIYTSTDTTGLFPIKSERTGEEELDKFVDALESQIEMIKADLGKRKAWNTDFVSTAKLDMLTKVVRSIQLNRDLSGYLSYINNFIFVSENRINGDISELKMEDLDKMSKELQFIQIFLTNTSGIMKLFKESHPEKYQQFNSELGTVLTKIDAINQTVKMISVDKLREYSAEQGMDENVFASYTTAADISSVQRWALSGKTINHSLIQVFLNEVDKLHAERIAMQNKLVRDTEALMVEYDKWAATKGWQGTDKYKFLLNNQLNLITEYSAEMWDERAKRRDTSVKQNLRWWKANFERSKTPGLDGRSDESKFIEDRDRYFKTMDELLAGDTRTAENRKQEWLRKNDITHPEFSNYFDNRYISPKNKEQWYSDKYRELMKPENKPARDLWEFLIKKNYEFREMVGYEFGIDRNFVPSIHKSMLDVLTQDGVKNTGIFKNYMNSIKNMFTGEEHDKTANPKQEKQIPILFMGFMDNENKSIDLMKNLMIFSTFINQYKHARKLESMGNIVRRILMTTDLAKIKRGSKIADPTNASRFITESSYDSNLIQAFDDYLGYYVYGETTREDAFTNALGEKGVRAVSMIQRITGRSAMAFNILSSFAGTVNARSQMAALGAEGKYFTTKQLAASQAAVSKFNAKLAFMSFEYEIGDVNAETEVKASKLSANKLVRKLGTDPAYIFERWFDAADQKSIYHAMMNNYGIDPNTGVIERLDKLKRKYKDSEIEFKSVWDCIEEKTDANGEKEFVLVNPYTNTAVSIEQLPNTDSLSPEARKERAMHMNTITSMRKKVKEVIARVKGNMSGEDIAAYRLSIMGRALGQFRNWIPATFNERLKGEAYNMTMEEYEIGRWRAAYRIGRVGLLKATTNLLWGLVPFTNKNFDYIGENPKMRDLYEQFIANNPTLREVVSYEDYVEEHKGKMRSLVREIQIFMAFLAVLQCLRALWDDEDDQWFLTNGILNIFERVNMELGFYLPMPFTPGWEEFKKLVRKDPLPLMAELDNMTGILTNTFAETLDVATGTASDKTISPRMTGTKWELNFDEKKDTQGAFHYTSKYLGIHKPLSYFGVINDKTKKEDTIWEWLANTDNDVSYKP